MKKTFEVSLQTLQAINAMMYGQQGVDLQSLIGDLCPNSENYEIVKLHVGLAFKGFKPNLPKPRMKLDKSWNSSRKPRLFIHVATHVSLIMNTITYQSFEAEIVDGKIKKDENGGFIYSEYSTSSCRASEWEESNEEKILCEYLDAYKAFEENTAE